MNALGGKGDVNKKFKEFIPSHATMLYFLNISSKSCLQNTSEIGWITKNNLILTLNNAYYLINLKQKDLLSAKNDIVYGKQQVNMGLFCSIV